MTPATLIGMLTILGYSLYDTVVVFDKVRENVRDIKSSTTKTYSEAANLAINQVLVRSINTTIIGVLPVAALLFAGAVILGEGPLKDLALALFVGMVSGAYSSIFIATPLLAQLKEREPDMKKLAARVAARRAKEAPEVPGRPSPAPEQPESSRVPAPNRAAAVATSAADDAEPPTARARRAERRGAGRCGAQRPHRDQDQPGEQRQRPDLRPLSDGAAKRPQPQHKPRSQRKK